MAEEMKDSGADRRGGEEAPDLVALDDVEDYKFDGFDPDDPNYRHHETLRAIQDMYNNLPEGWRRARDYHGRHIFAHRDGRTSFRNPAREEVKRVMAEMEEREPGVWKRPSDGVERGATIKKLKRMISVGMPMGAVENQARIDGVDMSDVLAEEETDGGTAGASDEKTEKMEEEKGGAAEAKDAPLVVDLTPVQRKEQKRLRKMLAAGVPRQAVEQQAVLKGILDRKLIWAEPRTAEKEEVEIIEGPGDLAKSLEKSWEMQRLRKMLAKGVPLPAVEQSARLHGIVDPAKVGAEAEILEKRKNPALFRTVEGGDGGKVVEFEPGTSPLAALVRRTVQTLKSRGGLRPGDVLAVDVKHLYDALGSLRKVRRDRDAYNAAADSADANVVPSPSDVRARRRPFLETLSSIGSRPPSSRRERADVDGLDDLLSLIESECADRIEARRSKVRAGTYDFESLAELFEPGTRAVARNAFASGVDVLVEVVWSKYEEGRTLFGMTRRFRVGFQFLVAVGGSGEFTLAEFSESMEKFDGNRDILSLPFVPLIALGDECADRTLARFRERGRMYGRCAAGATFLGYSKGSFYAKGGGGRSAAGRDSHAAALRMSGRVMVDNLGSYEAGHSVGVGYDPMVDVIKAKCKEYALYMRRMKQAASSSGGGGAAPAPTSEDMTLFSSIPDNYLAMTWPAAVGFSFTSKAWGDVLVDGLSDVEFNESAFDRLVLPRARKRMIKALVRHSADAFNDIVAGKGEGSVFLLYGPPGVGKTLTAEAISEMLHRPLYTVSLGQLGTSPAELESCLGEILELCGRWDALVLLDEADIFLEKRGGGSSSSLERNAMVSVMLRLVEYFRGVLFLTSNRVDALDPAFKTRITLALRYEPLDAGARAEVWANLLQASGQGAAIDEGRIIPTELAEHELNGREIKNAIRMAMALAEEDGEALAQRYIAETVDILMDFNAKMDAAEVY